jgi:hypothetical protein
MRLRRETAIAKTRDGVRARPGSQARVRHLLFTVLMIERNSQMMGFLVLVIVLLVFMTMTLTLPSSAITLSPVLSTPLRSTGIFCFLLVMQGDSIMNNDGIETCSGGQSRASRYASSFRSSALLYRALKVVGGGGVNSMNSSVALIDDDDEAEKAKLDAMIEHLLNSVASEDEKDERCEQPVQNISLQDESEKSLASLLVDQFSKQNENSRKTKSKTKSSKKRKEKQQFQPPDTYVAPSVNLTVDYGVGQSQQNFTLQGDAFINHHTDSLQGSATTPLQLTPPPPPPPPPNAFYRFLLKKGYFGHVILIALIAGNDWVERFLPPFYTLSRLFLLRLHIIVDPRSNLTTRYTSSKIEDGLTDITNEEYKGVISNDRGYGSKKLKNAKKKREDEIAYRKLIKVGSGSFAKYKHLSIDFMKR